MTTARLRRTVLLYGIVFATGVGLLLGGSAPGVRAFGLGLILPGSGFLLFAAGAPIDAVLHVALGFCAMAVFGVALVLWFASGNIVAPLAVWLGAAIGASVMGDHPTSSSAAWAIPVSVAGALLLGWARQRSRFRVACALRRERNEYLATARAIDTPRDEATGFPAVEELSREDVEALRFLLDRALQPVDEFHGFEWIEQFQTSAIRYQIMTAAYALSIANAVRMPALRGYLETAQRNLIEKAKDYRVWRYWQYENFFGNLRVGADPMAPRTHDNVMYAGWYAAMVGLYASATGEDRYDVPGAITLRHPRGRAYVYDWPSLVRLQAENFERSSFTLFPCEPNWIYPVCNAFAGMALRMHDRLRGTTDWNRVGRAYRSALDQEFTTADGRLVVIRSSRTGLSIPALVSVMTDTGMLAWLHGVVPDVARRTWEIMRHDFLSLCEGRLSFAPRGPDGIDVGSYRRSHASALASVTFAAGEMGDPELMEAARARLDEEHPAVTQGGVRHRPGVSVVAHLIECIGRLTRANGLHDLVLQPMPEGWRRGPILEEVAYPDVIIARAVSDGRALGAVALPGGEGGTFELGLARLVPGKRYRCAVAAESEVTADATGRARLRVRLHERTELRVHPVD